MAVCHYCDRPARSHGLCNAHYKKLRIYGDPLAGKTCMRSTDPLIRYHVKVERRGADECWPWLAGRSPDGYGTFAPVGGRLVLAHRYGYSVLVGPIEPKATIDHTCHNTDLACPGGVGCQHRACQNPAHWEAVSRRANTLRGQGPAALNARKTHCKSGHALTPENCRKGNRSLRVCATCQRGWQAKSRAKKKAQAL